MAAMRDLVQRARSGGLRSSELSLATVTVTSLGERGAESVAGDHLSAAGRDHRLRHALSTRPWVVDGADRRRARS